MTVNMDGKALRDKILGNLKAEVEKSKKKPCLAVIIVGNDPASQVYVNTKKKTSVSLGFESVSLELPENTSEDELLQHIDRLNRDDLVNGILVQMPLPKNINSERVIEAIDPQKDVDCFHPYNIGRIATNSSPHVYPCTPNGVISLLDEYKIPIEGQNVVIVGRSNIVGRPLAMMFVNRSATVTICHSKTKNLAEVTKNADILVVALGKPEFIKADMVKNGAVVVDVGINRVEINGEKKLVGDVDYESVKPFASFITPVPGGVGPMTICSLMRNTYDLFCLQAGV